MLTNIRTNYKYIIIIILLSFITSCASSLTKKRNHMLVRAAYKEIGKKYKWGGHSPKTGFDCSGLVYYIYRKNGFHVPRTTKKLYKAGERVYFFRRPGDLLFFNTEYRWWNPFSWFKVTHVGIYIGHNSMIHAPETNEHVHIVHHVFSNKYWKSKYKETRRMQYGRR